MNDVANAPEHEWPATHRSTAIATHARASRQHTGMKMAPKNIPDDLKEFIVLCIPSVAFLEAVFLMRSENQQSWDRQRLAGALYLDEGKAEKLLVQLERAETAVACNAPPSQYRYQPLSDLFRQRIDQLADLYSENLVGITKLIHRRARLRHGS
ncbi:MAG: hypothetical protein H7315_09800 [Herminiimonas sp.]|nr:hypothetical protein [Herminiimonas sp.]